MIKVIVSHPDGERDTVVFAGIPRIGESIRLTNDSNRYIVEYIIWTQGDSEKKQEPEVILSVRKRLDPR